MRMYLPETELPLGTKPIPDGAVMIFIDEHIRRHLIRNYYGIKEGDTSA